MVTGTRSDGAGHLPKQGGHTEPGPAPDLPTQRRGTTPQMRGRYPDYDVLATTRHWDALTRGVVLDRVANVPPIRFFDEPRDPDAARVLRGRDRTGSRAAHPGARDGRREALRGPARRVSLRRHARTTPRPGGGWPPTWTRAPGRPVASRASPQPAASFSTSSWSASHRVSSIGTICRSNAPGPS